jgi:ParB-like chromosome segregation protein Spo0J
MNLENLKIIYKPINELKNYENNSRVHSEEQINKLTVSITEFGFTNPILIDNNNVIIAGHARLAAAKKLGMNKLPCILLAHLTEQQRRALVIADNRLALDADWDLEKLREELNALSDNDFNTELLGFDPSELENMLSINNQIESPDTGINYQEKFSVLVECENENHQKQIYDELIKKGYTCRVLVN